jgi:glyoxylate reductase
LNARRLALLPQDSVVINTARGEIIDEKALIKSLASGKLFAAGLDVFEQEPLIPQALRKLPQVVLAPHLGSATRATRERMLEIVIEGTISALVN